MADFPVLPTGAIAIDPPPKSLFVKYDEQIITKHESGRPIPVLPVRIREDQILHQREPTNETSTSNRVNTEGAKPLLNSNGCCG